MRPPEGREEAREAETIAAESALGRGHLLEARQHLAEAERLGASVSEIRHLQSAVETAMNRRAQRERQAPWAGFGVGALGYLLLSLRQPPGWTIPVWAILAFLVVPGVIGYTTGRRQGFDPASRTRFWTAGRAGGGAMALYSGINLIRVRQGFSIGPETAEDFLAALFVMLVYAALAGAVAGAASALTRGAPGRGGEPERPA